MGENKLGEIMSVNLNNIKSMVDADTIIGTPITVEGVTLIPVSKVSFGTVTGGSDFATKSADGLFGGGGGAGLTVNPVAFIAVSNGNVKMMPIYNELGTVEKAINIAPEILDKIKSLFTKEKNKHDAE